MKLNLRQYGNRPAFAECGPAFWDVGARRYGPSFAPFVLQSMRLVSNPTQTHLVVVSVWRLARKFFETALGGPKRVRLCIYPEIRSARPFWPTIRRSARYGLENLFEIERRVHIPTVTMDRATAELGVPAPNLVKLDVEGLELDILKGGARRPGRRRDKLRPDSCAIAWRSRWRGSDRVSQTHGFCPVDIVDIALAQASWAGSLFRSRPAVLFARSVDPG